jgi:signal transduction histidine kinase
VGELLVIDGPENRLFEPEDVRLLELLAPQAAVAITNSRLFEQERELTSELAKAKTQLEAVLSNTDNPVLAVSKKMEILFANQAAGELLAEDDPQIDLKGRSLLEYVPRHYLPAKPRQLIKDLRRFKSFVYELQGRDKTYLCHLTRMKAPEKGWVAVLNDITTLKELDRLQRQMMELTTHQLKNPLQGAMLHLDELEDLDEDILTDEMKYDVQVIREQMERMHRLILGILQLERLKNTEAFHPEPIDLYQVVRGIVADLRSLAEAKDLELRLESAELSTPIMGDPQQLREAIICLVDNAIKYTPAGGSIWVRLRQENGQAHLEVQDTGIGIPPEAHAKIFERFYRVEQSGTEQIGGTGLGLSLLKTIIEGHRGQVHLESALNKGTTFFVTLPALTPSYSMADVR